MNARILSMIFAGGMFAASLFEMSAFSIAIVFVAGGLANIWAETR